MKTCVECGLEFKPQGRQKVCGGCKDAMREGLQEKVKANAQESRPTRPIDRFAGNRVVFPGQVGMRVLRRGT